MNPRAAAVALVPLLTLLSTPSGFSQGPLTPPGPPAPTMKSLDQVEARIPIDATRTPGDDNSQFRITQSGSYYLTGNIMGVSGKNGILVGAVSETIVVTIDLNGYSVTGVPGSLSGIVTLGGPPVTIRNGFVMNWGNSGISLGSRARVEGVTAEANGGEGIVTQASSLVIDCNAQSTVEPAYRRAGTLS